MIGTSMRPAWIAERGPGLNLRVGAVRVYLAVCRSNDGEKTSPRDIRSDLRDSRLRI
jgi:hypothetical protein